MVAKCFGAKLLSKIYVKNEWEYFGNDTLVMTTANT
jgi:hypothetical protein